MKKLTLLSFILLFAIGLFSSVNGQTMTAAPARENNSSSSSSSRRTGTYTAPVPVTPSPLDIETQHLFYALEQMRLYNEKRLDAIRRAREVRRLRLEEWRREAEEREARERERIAEEEAADALAFARAREARERRRREVEERQAELEREADADEEARAAERTRLYNEQKRQERAADSTWTDRDAAQRGLANGYGGVWQTKTFKVTPSGSNGLFLDSYLWAEYSRKDGAVVVTNLSKRYPAYFGLGVINDKVEPGQTRYYPFNPYQTKNDSRPISVDVTFKYWINNR